MGNIRLETTIGRSTCPMMVKDGMVQFFPEALIRRGHLIRVGDVKFTLAFALQVKAVLFPLEFRYFGWLL